MERQPPTAWCDNTDEFLPVLREQSPWFSCKGDLDDFIFYYGDGEGKSEK